MYIYIFVLKFIRIVTLLLKKKIKKDRILKEIELTDECTIEKFQSIPKTSAVFPNCRSTRISIITYTYFIGGHLQGGLGESLDRFRENLPLRKTRAAT